MDELNPSAFPNRLDYLQAVSAGRKELFRLEQELSLWKLVAFLEYEHRGAPTADEY